MTALAAVGLVTVAAFACLAELGRGCNIADVACGWLCGQVGHVTYSSDIVEFFVHALD